MKPRLDTALVFAHLQLSNPAARSYLVIAARGDAGVRAVGQGLCSTIATAGHVVNLIDVIGDARQESVPELPVRVGRIDLLESELGDPRRVKRAVEGGTGHTVVCAPSVLESAPSLLMSAAVDLVLVVAHRGRTTRSDLAAVGREIARAGGMLAGGVLVD